MMKSVMLNMLTKAINRYLKLDEVSAERLKKLTGKRASIRLLPIGVEFILEFSEDRVIITSYDESIVTGSRGQAAGRQQAQAAGRQENVSIHGTPLQFLGLALEKKHRHTFFADDVKIEGDAALGQDILDLFDSLQIDWEEQLSRITGDIPAHYTGRFLRKAREWLTQCDASMTQNINEFLHEEVNWLPSREALNDFFADIDTLRMDIDRMGARVQQLQSSMTDEGNR